MEILSGNVEELKMGWGKLSTEDCVSYFDESGYWQNYSIDVKKAKAYVVNLQSATKETFTYGDSTMTRNVTQQQQYVHRDLHVGDRVQCYIDVTAGYV